MDREKMMEHRKKVMHRFALEDEARRLTSYLDALHGQVEKTTRELSKIIAEADSLGLRVTVNGNIKQENSVLTDIAEPMINYAHLSRILTGAPRNITKGNIPVKYRYDINRLQNYNMRWLKWMQKMHLLIYEVERDGLRGYRLKK